MDKNKKPLLLLVLPQVQEGLFCCIHFLFCLCFFITLTMHSHRMRILEATPLSSYRFFKSFMAMCSESLIQVS